MVLEFDVDLLGLETIGPVEITSLIRICLE